MTVVHFAPEAQIEKDFKQAYPKFAYLNSRGFSLPDMRPNNTPVKEVIKDFESIAPPGFEN